MKKVTSNGTAPTYYQHEDKPPSPPNKVTQISHDVFEAAPPPKKSKGLVRTFSELDLAQWGREKIKNQKNEGEKESPTPLPSAKEIPPVVFRVPMPPKNNGVSHTPIEDLGNLHIKITIARAVADPAASKNRSIENRVYSQKLKKESLAKIKTEKLQAVELFLLEKLASKEFTEELMNAMETDRDLLEKMYDLASEWKYVASDTPELWKKLTNLVNNWAEQNKENRTI